MKLKLDTEIDALRANVTALQAMTKKTAQQCVKQSAIWILQSATRETPQAKKAKRDIIRAVRRYRHGVEELARNARPEAPGDKALFLISRPRNRRPISKSGDRRFWVFETMAAAKAHQDIVYRGAAKAGWWSQLPSLGAKVAKSFEKSDYLAAIPGIKETTISLDELVPSVVLNNRSKAITGHDFASIIRNRAILRTNNRIAGMAKANERRLAAFRQAGGMVWHDASEQYIPLED